MLSILLKIKSKIVCVIDDKEYCYPNGISAYYELKNAYSIISMAVRDNTIIVELEGILNNSNWEKEYEDQFGKEPSFF